MIRDKGLRLSFLASLVVNGATIAWLGAAGVSTPSHTAAMEPAPPTRLIALEAMRPAPHTRAAHGKGQLGSASAGSPLGAGFDHSAPAKPNANRRTPKAGHPAAKSLPPPQSISAKAAHNPLPTAKQAVLPAAPRVSRNNTAPRLAKQAADPRGANAQNVARKANGANSQAGRGSGGAQAASSPNVGGAQAGLGGKALARNGGGEATRPLAAGVGTGGRPASPGAGTGGRPASPGAGAAMRGAKGARAVGRQAAGGTGAGAANSGLASFYREYNGLPRAAAPAAGAVPSNPAGEVIAPSDPLHLPLGADESGNRIPGSFVPENMRRLVVSPKAHRGSEGSQIPGKADAPSDAPLTDSVGALSERGNIPWAPDDPKKIAARALEGKGKADGGGDGAGLLGEYFLGQNFEQSLFKRPDPNINFTWTGRVVDPRMPVGVPFSVRWTGTIRPRYTETYTFHTASDDGVRLLIDGKPVIVNWTVHAATEDVAQIDLQAGHAYPIVVEYYEKNGRSRELMKLYWESASQIKEYVPESCLGYPKESGGFFGG